MIVRVTQDHYIEEDTHGLYYCQLEHLEDEALGGDELRELEELHVRAQALNTGFLRPFKVRDFAAVECLTPYLSARSYTTHSYVRRHAHSRHMSLVTLFSTD